MISSRKRVEESWLSPELCTEKLCYSPDKSSRHLQLLDSHLRPLGCQAAASGCKSKWLQVDTKWLQEQVTAKPKIKMYVICSLFGVFPDPDALRLDEAGAS